MNFRLNRRGRAVCVAVGLLALGGGSLTANAGEAEGFAWLAANQNGDGSWGDQYEMIVTSTVLETLTDDDPCGNGVGPGASWLADQSAANHEFLARQICGLATVPSFQSENADLVGELLAVRNPVEPNDLLPNWPEGGWGVAEGFETDCLTTALGLLALDRSGFNGGFSVIGEPLVPGGTNVHGWEIPGDATKVRFLITVGGSDVRLCMTEGAPPPFCSSYFPLPSGPTFLITLPDDGLPFTPGTNFVVIESTGPAASYTLTASYETPTFDTRTLAEPLDYLRESQNPDGGWGLQRGQSSDFYTSLHALLAMQRYGQYALDPEIAGGIAYVKTEQLVDGSFGFGGPGIPYVTALAALNLIRSESSPFGVETEDAVSALSAMQDVDGSWEQEAYDTALAVLALREHGEPPLVEAGLDRSVPDPEVDCVESIALSGSATAFNGTIVGYEWKEDCATIATGASPVVVLPTGEHVLTLTVTDSDGQSSSDLVTVTVVDAGADHDHDGLTECEGDCDDFNGGTWSAPSEVRDVVFTSGTRLVWDVPFVPGGHFPAYDVLRSGLAADFENAVVCVESDDASDLEADVPGEPFSGQLYYYLVRAETDCPSGVGPLGACEGGLPRTGVQCP